MKITGFALLLTAIAAHGDILSDTSSFLGSPNPNYDPKDLDPGVALTNPNHAPFSPADSDFGVQQVLGVTPDRAPINFLFSVDFNYTDNAPAATSSLQDASFYYSTVIGATWKPHIANGWFADVGVTEEFYEFDQTNAMDFRNIMSYVGVVKNLVDLDDTVFFTRYEFQCLSSASLYDSNYNAQRIRAGLQKMLFLTSHQRLSAGVSAALDLNANPDLLSRKEYVVELSYTYSLTDSLSATALWRTAFWYFDNGGRHDRNNLAGLELNYQLCKNATAYASVYYTDNNSNASSGANDIESWQGGLGLGMNYSF